MLVFEFLPDILFQFTPFAQTHVLGAPMRKVSRNRTKRAPTWVDRLTDTCLHQLYHNSKGHKTGRVPSCPFEATRYRIVTYRMPLLHRQGLSFSNIRKTALHQ
jgi:hypothetical protein